MVRIKYCCCHVGETFLGAVAWADDFLLLAPNRESMQIMLNCCQDFSIKHNLEFSSDPDPVKTKSKAIFMIGKKTHLQKLVNLLLPGNPLPWVYHATLLGHEFHEDGTMRMDCRMKRGYYIGRSLEVRKSFSFAAPAQVLAVIKLYASDLGNALAARGSSCTAGHELLVHECQGLVGCLGP